jgi:hypothetical protein
MQKVFFILARLWITLCIACLQYVQAGLACGILLFRFPIPRLFVSFIQWLDCVPCEPPEQQVAAVTRASPLWTNKWGQPRTQALNSSGKFAPAASNGVIREA